MKRLVLIALLLSGSAISAHADNDIYNNILKQQRGDDALHADTAICDAEIGAPQNGQVTSRAIQALHAQPWLALRPYRPRTRQARRPLSRPRQSRDDVPRLQDRRRHRIELLEFWTN